MYLPDTICPTCGCDLTEERAEGWWELPEGAWPRVKFIAIRLLAVAVFAAVMVLAAIGTIVVGVSLYLG